MSALVNLTRMLGFHQEFLARMGDPALQKWLTRVNLAVACGLGLMTLAIGLMVWMFSAGNWAGALSAIFGAGVSYTVLVKLHSLLITLGSAPLDRHTSENEQWRPSRLRLLAFAILAVLLSQPLLLWIQGSELELAAMERVKFRTTVQFEAQERTKLIDKQQDLLVQRSILNDESQRITSSLNSTGAKSSTSAMESTRKAILVGASNYLGNVNKLPNVTNDIVGMERKLRSMGYAVTVSMDDSRTDLRRKLETYSASLKSGDISLIYFSGHGLENAGHNYFIPRDFGAQSFGPITKQLLQENAVSITPYIDDLTRERLRLHLLILDACRTGIEGKPRGLADMRSMAGRNVILSMAASPGQEAFDGLPGQIGGNSPYTKALLKNLDRDEDVLMVFRRVAKEVVETTTPITSKENLPPQTPTLTHYIPDLELKLLPPALEQKKAVASLARSNSLPLICNADYERTGNLSGLSSCLNREISAINRQVEFLEDRLGAEAGQSDKPLDGLLERAVFFAERLRLMWTNYLLSFVGTLFFASLMIAGLAVRDLLTPQAVRAYEKVKNRDQRTALRNYHNINQSAIDLIANPLRAKEQLPRFEHWSKEEDFFAESKPRKAISTGIDIRIDPKAAEKMWEWLQNPKATKDQE